MLMSNTRFAASITWFLAGLATLVWLPRLLGTEPLAEKTPSVVILDVTESPREQDAADQTPPSQPAELDKLRLLVPLEADLTNEDLADQSAPSLGALLGPDIVADGESENDLSPLKLNNAPTLATQDDQPQTPPPQTIAPRRQVLSPPKEPQEYAPGSSSNANSAPTPLIPLPNEITAQPIAGPAVKYWIVSTRCCSQSKHRCAPSCRFLCHAVTEDCQIHPACFEELLGSLIPNAPVSIFAHGAFTRWQDVWQDAEQTYQWLRSPCPQLPLNFIYFTWPSEGVLALASDNAFTSPIPGIDFMILGRRAERNGFYLADLIGALPPNSPVSLLGHSQGARTISSALHLLGGGTVQKQARWNPADCGNRIRVVFGAAAIDHDWLNPDERYGCALNRAECLLNLRNDRDFALALYPFRHPFSARSLARAGFTKRDRRHLGEHVCQVSELDVTPLIGHHHSWPQYLCRPEIAAAIAPYVYFESAAFVPAAPVSVER